MTEGCSEANLKALGLFLQHPVVCSDAKVICKCLQVCKCWNAQVHQHAATSVDVHLQQATEPSISSMTAWLGKNPGLARSLVVKSNIAGPERAQIVSAAEELIECALRARSPNSTSIAPCTAAAEGETAQLPVLLLRNYESNLAVSSAILSKLPSMSLTSLCLGLRQDTKAVVTAINRLTNLKQLKLEDAPIVDSRSLRMYESFGFGLELSVPDLSTLAGLTRLELHMLDFDWDRAMPLAYKQTSDELSIGVQVFSGNANLQSLPEGLLELHIETMRCYPRLFIDLAHLQHLQRLALRAPSLHPRSNLPTSLGELSLESFDPPGAPESFELSRLSSLKRLTLFNPLDNAEGLYVISRLPQLQHMAIIWHEKSPTALQAWAHLPQLRELQITLSFDDNYRPFVFFFRPFGEPRQTESALWQLLSHVVAVPQLTKLTVDVDYVSPTAEPLPKGTKFNLCQKLNALTALQDLKLAYRSNPVDSDICDILSLSALLCLTRLELVYRQRVVSARVVASLRQKLPNLRQVYLDQPYYSGFTGGISFGVSV